MSFPSGVAEKKKAPRTSARRYPAGASGLVWAQRNPCTIGQRSERRSWFDDTIGMAQQYERSIGAIIFRFGEPPSRERYFLLLRYPGGYWEFARGHVEDGERERTTARRELSEETGITNARFLPGFRERYRFQFQRDGSTITKDAIIYLAEVSRWTVRVSDEHFGYVWMPGREALRALRFENSRAVLRRALVFLAAHAPAPATGGIRKHSRRR